MRQPRRYTTEAIVIRHLDYGEADRILTLWTPGLGKIHAIVKGVRRPRSKSGGHLDLFTRGNLLLAQGRNLDLVTQAESLEYFTGLRLNLMRAGYAHYVCELLDAFVPDRQPNHALYRTHLTTLRRLEAGGSLLDVRSFEMTLLDLSGYRPQLHTCLGCGVEIRPATNHFSVALGGVLCPDCQAEDSGAKPISVPALKLLRHLQTDPTRIVGLQSVDDRVTREVEHSLHEYIAYRLERKPKSLAVLEALHTRLAQAGA